MKARNAQIQVHGSQRFSTFDFRISLIIVCLLAGFVPGCRPKTNNAADFLPAGNAVPGWAKTSDTRTFSAADLWKYIDGDADKYVQAGVVNTLTSDYRLNGKTDATLDVYVMGSTAGAQKNLRFRSGGR